MAWRSPISIRSSTRYRLCYRPLVVRRRDGYFRRSRDGHQKTSGWDGDSVRETLYDRFLKYTRGLRQRTVDRHEIRMTEGGAFRGQVPLDRSAPLPLTFLEEVPHLQYPSSDQITPDPL